MTDDADEIDLWWKWRHAYAQDPIAPILVEHALDYGDPSFDAEGRPRFGYCYVYLTYRFREGDEAAEAMHYTDGDVGVTVSFHGGGEPRASAFARRVLIFLAMRYERVFIDRNALDPALAADLATWRDEHMRRAGPD